MPFVVCFVYESVTGMWESLMSLQNMVQWPQLAESLQSLSSLESLKGTTLGYSSSASTPTTPNGKGPEGVSRPTLWFHLFHFDTNHNCCYSQYMSTLLATFFKHTHQILGICAFVEFILPSQGLEFTERMCCCLLFQVPEISMRRSKIRLTAKTTSASAAALREHKR